MRWLAILVATIAVLSSVGAQPKGELHLFVPCGMIVPFQRLKTEFERQTGIKLRITYDNGVMLVRRIREKGERPDILVAPGELEIQQLLREGFIDPKSVVTFGTFKLILVVPARNRAGIQSLNDLLKPSVRRIAIADPKLNSVGYYAQQALMNLGLWEKLKGKIVTHWHAQEAVNYMSAWGELMLASTMPLAPLIALPKKSCRQTTESSLSCRKGLTRPSKFKRGC